MACDSVTSPSRGLGLFLLATQFLSVLAHQTAGNALRSLLADGNRTVPDYVTRYAPLVRLHSEDPFRPADLLQHLRHTTPTVDQQPVPGVPELDLDNLAVLNGVDGNPVALSATDNITTLPAWLFGEAPDASGRIYNATPCVVILVEHSSSDIDAFFFYFYSFNRGANITQVMEPLNRLIFDAAGRMNFANHVGDWEHNMVRFRDGKPTGIYYSQHSGGAAYDWDDSTLSMQDERPIVFSAYGSHANYPTPGDHVHDAVLIDYCDAGPTWDPVFSAYFYHLEPSSLTLTRMFPPSGSNTIPASSNSTSFFYYTGIWGDAQYPDTDPRQKTVPYFGIKRYVSGPTGPVDKQLVRKGLFPDHPSQKSWVQWGVAVFMSWYPCCIRGWRVWVSMTLLFGGLVLVGLGIRYGIRRYKARGYTKIGMEEEVALNDLDRREEDVGLLHDED
ncbi:hypothetical protein BX600DRAFT_515886 [Xylariales sp. PMI_506]|nr:hypothetical protein BX600DRAFT_515886 [Xylariales sp. PMI_506]